MFQKLSEQSPYAQVSFYRKIRQAIKRKTVTLTLKQILATEIAVLSYRYRYAKPDFLCPEAIEVLETIPLICTTEIDWSTPGIDSIGSQDPYETSYRIDRPVERIYHRLDYNVAYRVIQRHVYANLARMQYSNITGNPSSVSVRETDEDNLLYIAYVYFMTGSSVHEDYFHR